MNRNMIDRNVTDIRKQFMKYVSQNILGMVGISLYILADTFFISKAVGTNGIAALNLVLPIYSFIFAIGMMLGVGSAIRFSILKSQKNGKADLYFSNAIIWGTIFSMVFIISGVFFPETVLHMMGADGEIVLVGKTYTQIFMGFAPLFIWNNICNAFVRNDGNPSIAMAATLISSLFNIVADYVLMFPLGMGMPGAALATAISPGIGIVVCMFHFCSEKSSVRLRRMVPSVRKMLESCRVGISTFIGEMASAVIVIVFNMLVLNLAGNVGVAAYGVVANTSLVAVAVFNGVSNGVQPLSSTCYGKGEMKHVSELLKLGIGTAILLAIVIIGFTFTCAEGITAIFNSEQNMQMAKYASEGIRLYFVGFLFAGINIVGIGILSSVESTKWAFTISMMRGLFLITLTAVIMANIWGMRGIWMSFPVTEAITVVITIFALRRMNRG